MPLGREEKGFLETPVGKENGVSFQTFEKSTYLKKSEVKKGFHLAESTKRDDPFLECGCPALGALVFDEFWKLRSFPLSP
jgi:hypothetical protein